MTLSAVGRHGQNAAGVAVGARGRARDGTHPFIPSEEGSGEARRLRARAARPAVARYLSGRIDAPDRESLVKLGTGPSRLGTVAASTIEKVLDSRYVVVYSRRGLEFFEK
jgi:hypothetical protein